MKSFFYLLNLLLFFVSLVTFAQPKKFYAKVIGIKDGDTITILYNDQQYTVRLSHIDCPEKKQEYGNKAKQKTANLCFGNIVWIQSNGKKDRYGRILAEVVVNNKPNVNKKLVEEGLAWHFKRYSEDTVYTFLENKARSEKKGIWKQQNPIAPWVWRKQKH